MTARSAIVVLSAIAGVAATSSCNGTFRFDERSTPPIEAGADRDAADAGPAVAGCKMDVDCMRLGLRCDMGSGRCVACLGDDDCAGPTPRCSPVLRVCVGCLEIGDCNAKQRCDARSMTCLDTCAEGEETCPIAGFVCDEHAKLCVECRTISHCTGNPHGSRCAADIGRCVECLGNAQCPADRPQCDPRRGACVGCVAPTDCSPRAACDPSTSACSAVH
jgi:hypothetical protein